MSDAEALVYDSVELRRRIVVAFSAGELGELAQELGVAGSVRWDRGPQEAARDIVRQFEKGYGGLDTLVAKLRQKKPLVEWPEPGPPPSMAPMSSRMPYEAPPVSHNFGAAPPLVSPGSFGGPQPTIPGAPAFAAPPAAPVAEPAAAPVAAPRAVGAPQVFAAPVPPPQAAWPGTLQTPQKAAPTGVDPRILIVVAGLMLVAGFVAYLAGRATTAASATAAPVASNAAPSMGRRPDGPATHLADSLERGVADVARACEVRMGSAEEVFARSFEQCGPGAGAVPHTRTPSAAPSPPRPANGRDDQVRRGGPDAPPRDQPGAGCIKGCAAEQASCRSGCGPEPSEASRYGDYQQCFGRCITQASKCRLACQ